MLMSKAAEDISVREKAARELGESLAAARVERERLKEELCQRKVEQATTLERLSMLNQAKTAI